MVVAVPVGVSRIRDETHRNATTTSMTSTTTTPVPSHANRRRCVVVASHLLRSCVRACVAAFAAHHLPPAAASVAPLLPELSLGPNCCVSLARFIPSIPTTPANLVSGVVWRRGCTKLCYIQLLYNDHSLSRETPSLPRSQGWRCCGAIAVFPPPQRGTYK